MHLHNASCELRNPPQVHWRWISIETAIMGAIGMTAWLFA